VNGVERELDLDVRASLLDLLRDGLGLTGAKRGCERGDCGACTVLVEGRPALACLALAVAQHGRAVTTVEGLAAEGELHPLQRAFVAHDALQCGFCTPGQIMAAQACLAAGRAGSESEVREWMSGNLCRCAAYPQIVAAIRAVVG
jgi:xanthine dehydrogenase YagT iron-sulfur-binding subunit